MPCHLAFLLIPRIVELRTLPRDPGSCFEDIRERGHPARLPCHNYTHAASRMPALPGTSWSLGGWRIIHEERCARRAGLGGISNLRFKRKSLRGGATSPASRSAIARTLRAGCPRSRVLHGFRWRGFRWATSGSWRSWEAGSSSTSSRTTSGKNLASAAMVVG